MKAKAKANVKAKKKTTKTPDDVHVKALLERISKLDAAKLLKNAGKAIAALDPRGLRMVMNQLAQALGLVIATTPEGAPLTTRAVIDSTDAIRALLKTLSPEQLAGITAILTPEQREKIVVLFDGFTWAAEAAHVSEDSAPVADEDDDEDDENGSDLPI